MFYKITLMSSLITSCLHAKITLENHLLSLKDV